MATLKVLRRFFLLIPLALLLPLFLLPSAAAAEDTSKTEAAGIAAARAVFEKNLQAIRDRDKAAYLSCYLDSESLARTGFEGPQLGYKGLAAGAGQGWPDHIDADDVHLTVVRPGLVYGTYRYRVRYGGREDTGISERLFLQPPQGGKMAATPPSPAQPGVRPPPRPLVGAPLVEGIGAPPVP